MTIEDGDLKQRLKLAQEKIARLEQENAELLDMRTLILVLAKSIDAWADPVQEDPEVQRWVDWSRNAVTLMKAKQRMQPRKKSPAERRAEMTRLWAAERDKF